MLFGRKSPPTPTTPTSKAAPPAARPTMPPTTPSPAATGPGAGVVPSYVRVLTRHREPFFDDDSSGGLAALELEGGTKRVAILRAAGASAAQYLSLRGQLARAGYALESDEPRPAPAALVQELNAIRVEERAPARVISTGEHTSPLRSLWDDLLGIAVSVQASDVHIEVRTDEPSRVRLRVGGDMLDIDFATQLSRPSRQLQDMIGYLYQHMAAHGTGSEGEYKKADDQSAQLAELDVRDARTGKVRRISGRIQTMRVAGQQPMDGPAGGVVPCDLVVRVLFNDDRSVPALQALGHLPSQIEAMSNAVARRSGLLSISGRIGNGKSTTLRSLFAMLPGTWAKSTLEDPVEYWHPNASRAVVQRSAGDRHGAESAFAGKLLVFKRLDRDTVLIGEIRDGVSMAAVRDFTFSGHPVFTTLHAHSALGQIPRMLTPEMGLSAYDIADPAFLNTVIHQALVPRLCPQCAMSGDRAKRALGAEYLNQIESKFEVDIAGFRARNPDGCSHCQGSKLPGLYGYAGREVVAEWWTPDFEDRVLLRERKDLELLRRFRGSRRAGFDAEDTRGKVATEVGLYKALQGIMDPRSVEDKFGPWALHQTIPRQAAGQVISMQPRMG